MSQTNFTPSINLARDVDREFDYIPTPNAQRIFDQITENYRRGIRAFNIIGSYGTGKSAFLVAFESSLKRRKDYFEVDGHFNGLTAFRFRNLVGDFDSLIHTFAKYYEIHDATADKSRIFEALNKDYQKAQQDNALLVIVIDEFGKFLEYTAQNDPENELYFVQQLAEFVSDKDILLITTLHQSFDSYSRKLYRTQQQEWEKVKGRLKELPFNEPVEQLLHLAAHHLAGQQESAFDDRNLPELLSAIEKAGVFPLSSDLSEEFARRLLPMDVLAAATLTLALQRYGQNERSLFSFLQAADYLGINDEHARNAPYYNLTNVYDYLLHNFYSFLSTKYNPDYTQWAAIRKAVERVEAVFEGNMTTALKLVKTIGLLSIFGNEGAKVNRDFLEQYGKLALGVDSVADTLAQLASHKIIRYITFKNKFVLFEGTDLDIDLALSRAGDKVEPIENIVTELKRYFHFPYFPAKAAMYKTGTPRFFEMQLSETPIDRTPAGEVDGFINLIFSDRLSKQEVSDFSDKVDDCVVLVLYKNTAKIRECLLEIRKTKHVSRHCRDADDRVALRELRSILAHHIEELNHLVLRNLFAGGDEVAWFFKGTEIQVRSRLDFNALLSKLCEQIYSRTPIFHNELVNRHRPSSSVTIARKNFFEALLNRWQQEDLGFAKDKFPPEKTIYYTLLKKTGIHRQSEAGYSMGPPTDESFVVLWQASETFLDSTKVSKKGLDEFVELLACKPFKLKQGLIDFWMPLFLFIKRDDFALFSDDAYVPFITPEVLELIIKKPQSFKIKAFNVAGFKLDLFNKYRALLNKESSSAVSNTTFIDTIRPFLTFYRDLPEYTKKTRRLSQSAHSLREAIAHATDPEETFFEHFPKALGYSDLRLREDDGSLENYFFQLQNAIRELRSNYDELLNRVEAHFLQELGYSGLSFKQYKEKIQSRYRGVKQHLLLPYQKTFLIRLNSELDDRKAWINSLTHALIGKNLDALRDEEEELLHERFVSIFRELDNLCEISELEFDESKEDVLRMEFTTVRQAPQKLLLRIPKNRNEEAKALEERLTRSLSKDKKLNAAVLSKLLKRELDDE